MVTAKEASGNRLFTRDDFLSASQISGFFSRLSAKKILYEEVKQMAKNVFQIAADEVRIDELTNVPVQEL